MTDEIIDDEIIDGTTDYLAGDWTDLFPLGSMVDLAVGDRTEHIRIIAYIPGCGTSFSVISEEEYTSILVEEWSQQFLDNFDEDDVDISC